LTPDPDLRKDPTSLDERYRMLPEELQELMAYFAANRK
jgi:hypothetical protein